MIPEIFFFPFQRFYYLNLPKWLIQIKTQSINNNKNNNNSKIAIKNN